MERKKSELFVSSTTDNCFVSQHQRRRVKWEVTEYTIFQLFLSLKIMRHYVNLILKWNQNHRCIRQCNMQNRKLKDIKCDRYFVNEISLFVKEYVSWLMIAIFSDSSEKKRIKKLCQLIFILCHAVITE